MTNEPLTIWADLLDGRIEVTTTERGTTDGPLDGYIPGETWKAVELAFEGAGGWRPDAALDALIETGCAEIPDDMEPAVIIDGRTYGLDVRLAHVAERLIIDHENPPTESRFAIVIDDGLVDVEVTRRGPVVSMAADLACLARHTLPTPPVAREHAAGCIMRMIGEQIARDYTWSIPVGIDVNWTSTHSTGRSSTDVGFDIAPSGSETGCDVTCRACAPPERYLRGVIRPSVTMPEALATTAAHLYEWHRGVTDAAVGGDAPAMAVRVTFIDGDDS